MRIFLLTAALSAAVLSATAHASQASASPPLPNAPSKTYPLRDFFKNAERSFFKVSPDGKSIAFLQAYNNRLNIHLQPIEKAGTHEGVQRVTEEDSRDIADFDFKGSDRVIYLKDKAGDENFHVISVDLKSKKSIDLTPHEGTRAEILNMLHHDDAHILVTHNKRKKEVFDVYRIHLGTGQENLVAANTGKIDGWSVDHAGQVRAATVQHGLQSVLMYREHAGQKFKPVLKSSGSDSFFVLGWTADNQKMYLSSNAGRDKSAIFEFDPKIKKLNNTIYANPEVDVYQMHWSHARRKITHVDVDFEKTTPVFLDSQMQRIYLAIQAQLPDTHITIQSQTTDEQRMVIAASSDLSPGGRYLYDVPTDRLLKLGDINPAIAAADMSPMQPIAYKARDGLLVRGYLTLPRGLAPQNLPVIVHPHGGPWHRDSWGYDATVQFLANRGYAVLQMNFRGSTGYGRQFLRAGNKQWGLAMQNDITDGVHWLIKQGIADPKRIGIYGASYGGYAALSGITQTPDLYAAAVSYVGVSNLFTFMDTIPPYWSLFRPMLYERVGHPKKDRIQFKNTSPALNAHKIKTPLFVAQGANDPRVAKAESDQMVQALRDRGIHVDYMVKDDEGHGFANEENQFEFYGAMEKFFEIHLKHTR